MRYALLGQGRWGSAVRAALEAMGRQVHGCGLSRPAAGDDPGRYLDLLRVRLAQLAEKADVLWVAIPPGEHEEVLTVALQADYHVIVEKPWLVGKEGTARLAGLALDRRRCVGVDYQYCLLEELRRIADRIAEADETPERFVGKFHVARENRLGLTALDNLGAHLMAIRNHFFPEARVQSIDTSYASHDARWVEIATGSKSYHCDLSQHKQDILQDFIGLFEEAVRSGQGFPFSLGFARKVSADLHALENPLHKGQRAAEPGADPRYSSSVRR